MSPSLLLLLLLESPFSDPEDWKEKNSLVTSSDTGSALLKSFSNMLTLTPTVVGENLDAATKAPMRVAAPPLPGSEAGPEARLRILGSFRDEILESLIALPDLTALRDFYFQPFPDFAYDILNNVLAQGREKTFHYIYDALIAEPGETEGNPAEELVNKDGWPYGDSIPYIPAYYARAFVVTFCVLYQENGVTYRLDLQTLDIRTAEGRLGVFMAFLKVAQLVHKLEAICQSSSVPPIKRMESRWSGKTLRVLLQQSGEDVTDIKATRACVDFDDVAMSPSDGADYLELSAPQICGKHDCKVDIWGVGSLIAYYPTSTMGLSDFKNSCLSKDPKARPTASECLTLINRLREEQVDSIYKFTVLIKLEAQYLSRKQESSDIVHVPSAYGKREKPDGNNGTWLYNTSASAIVPIWLFMLPTVPPRKEIQPNSPTLSEGF
ncbi:hypothetical protein SELMODRAFT_410623 [Selaginella moellendorffii]|uniref:Protein kinase domain-containing protein n=1 Tax=Selaginella moellendorffii TaxID=88036 RepID=D8RFB9_SELML|nr:hypothetical protein SELMODRAFT_410623 [Selaginella moellendorffii]